MSLFVLDTDTLSLYRKGHTAVCQQVASHPQVELAITIITVEEQLTGWYTLLRRVTRPDDLARAYQRLGDTVQHLASWQILPYTTAAIAGYDQLSALHLNVRKMDLRIAAIALEHAGTVVTRNLRDFQRIPNLPVVDWAV
jgi:tRNA(fMet)-specific endonuclease VapC